MYVVWFPVSERAERSVWHGCSGMGWQDGKELEIKPTSGRPLLPSTSSWVSSDRERAV